MRILTGLQPSGAQLHIGNYLGAVKPMVEKQGENEVFMMVANYHAMTSVQDGKKLAEQTLETATEYLACGIDPAKTTLFFQSDVPEHCELAWILSCLTPMGLLERAVAYKDKVANGLEASVGLFTYPALMAADILIYQTNIVPVGKDQKQHVEIARDLAEKFNNLYGETFTLPDAQIDPDLATVPGIDGRKMSKSYGNFIGMFEEEKTILKKIKSIVTDSKGLGELKDTETCNVFALYRLFANENEITEMRKKYEEGIGYGQAKEALYEVFLSTLKPIREKYGMFKNDPEGVKKIMKVGGEKARSEAMKTMKVVRERVGI